MLRRRAGVAAASVAAALSLGACGADVVPGFSGDDSDTREGRAAKAVVVKFAESSGPEACDLFTPAGLRKVYGAKEPPAPPPEITAPPPAVSLASCRERSARFQGQKVEIEKVDKTESGKFRIDASVDDGARTFVVTLEKRPRDGQWLIEEIREQ